MTELIDTERELRLDPEGFAGRAFRNAVYRHWDPYEDVAQDALVADRETLIEHDWDETLFEEFRTLLALFGAGEEAVTEDLMPLALALDDVDRQMFVASQIYEEAKHTQFFDRYWREVVDPVARELGYERTVPTDPRYFSDEYEKLFERTEAAMERLLEADTPEHRAVAYCHYHLVVESVLAQTGYYAIQSSFGPDTDDEVTLLESSPRLDGLVEGITYVRSDEGRHVGFGMDRVRTLVHREGVDRAVVRETLQTLLPYVAGTLEAAVSGGTNLAPLVEYAREKVEMRIDRIVDADGEIPPVEELVAIDDR